MFLTVFRSIYFNIPFSFVVNSIGRVIMTVNIRRHIVVLLGQGVDGGPGGAVVTAGTEVVPGDAEGPVVAFLAGEAPAVGAEGGEAVLLPRAEDDAFEGPCTAGGLAVGEGAVVVIPCPGGIEDRCLRPVGEI